MCVFTTLFLKEAVSSLGKRGRPGGFIPNAGKGHQHKPSMRSESEPNKRQKVNAPGTAEKEPTEKKKREQAAILTPLTATDAAPTPQRVVPMDVVSKL